MIAFTLLICHVSSVQVYVFLQHVLRALRKAPSSHSFIGIPCVLLQSVFVSSV